MIKFSDVKVQAQYRTRVRYRLVVLEYAGERGAVAAGRHYGLSAWTIRWWRKRWRHGGVEGLVPTYPRHRPRRVSPSAVELIRHARQELGYGAARTRLWLKRVHGIRLAMGTIQRVFRDLGVPRLRRTRKRQPRLMELFEKAEPGESIQVDVKYVSTRVAGPFSTRPWTTVRASACCGFTGGCPPARAGPSRSPLSGCSATTGKSSPSPSCWGSKPLGSATDTFGLGARSRTAKSSGAIESIKKSSGAGTASRISTRPLPLCGPGRPDTTMSASRWRSRAVHRPRNSRRSIHQSGSHRRLMSTRDRHQKTGVNLDETQQRHGLPGTSVGLRGENLDGRSSAGIR